MNLPLGSFLDAEQYENGERCLICEEIFAEDYGRPLACESCGGDGVLLSMEDDEEDL